MAPKIYKKWDTLKDKLLQIDQLDIDGKEVGREYTLAFEFPWIDLDPLVPIVPKSILDKWIEAKQQGELLNLKLPTPESKQIKSPVRSRKPIVKSRPRHSEQKSTNNQPTSSTSLPVASCSSDSFELNQTTPKPRHVDHEGEKSNAPVEEPHEKEPRSPAISQVESKLTQPPEIIDIKSTQSSVETIDSTSTKVSADVINTNNSSYVICRGNIDQLVLRERIDDEFRFNDINSEPDTQLQKTLKKIRCEPDPTRGPKPQASITSDYTKRNETFRPPSTSAVHSRPASTSAHTESSRLMDPKPQPPPKPKEPDWNETSKQLQLNQFDNVYKDLKYFKDRISSDDKAKKLILDAAIKCLTEDNTSQLIDMLDLIYGFDFHKDNSQYWSELLLRLKRKVQPNSLYKSKTDKDNVRKAYCCALDSVLNFANSANLKLTLSYNDMVYFTTSQHKQSAIRGQPNIPNALIREEHDSSAISSRPDVSCSLNLEQNSTKNMSSDQTGAINGYTPVKTKVETKKEVVVQPLVTRLKAVPFDIKPDVKVGVKQDRQENVDPSTVRKVTLVKDAEGKPSFRIVRSRNAIAARLPKQTH